MQAIKKNPSTKYTKKVQQLEKEFESQLVQISKEKSDTIASNLKGLIEPANPADRVTKNKNILLAIGAALIGVILPQVLIFAGLSIAGLAVAVVAVDKKIKRLEKLEQEYPGILTLRQRGVLADYKKLSSEPKMQGLIKNMHLRVALSTIVDTTLKQQSPSLVTALGGMKKATKDFKKYAERTWKVTKLQEALKEGVGKIVAFKMRARLRFNRAKLRSQEKKLIAKVKKAKLDVAQLKTALDSTAQKYMQQADAIMEDLARQLIEAVEAGKINLQTEPVIEL